MIRTLLLTATALSFTACATTDIARTANAIKTARTAQKISTGAADLVSKDVPMDTTTTATLTQAAPINADEMSIPMVKTSGKTKVAFLQPKIALVGYNIGAFIDATATGKAGGDLLGYSQGSRTTINMTAAGISEDMLQRVANTAHDDLAAKLTAAGFAVVTADQVAATPSAGNLKFSGPSYTTKMVTERGKKTVLVVGPSVSGAQKHLGIGKTSMGGNGIVKPSSELEAVMLMPNLVLDFAALSTKGMQIGTKSSAKGEVRFAVDPASGMNMQGSKGRFLDGWLNYGVKKPVIVDADFAILSESRSKSNSLEQGLGLALGMATAAKKTKEVVVSIDPVRYEALAMNAAQGWNTAFVAQMVSARSDK